MQKKKLKHYKVGLDSETYKISMVSEPAISVDYVALAKDNQIKLSSDERHICYGPALIPNLDIYRNNGQTEYYLSFSEESIIKMSQEFMKNYRQHEVNLQHEDDVDEVYVCESWLVEDPYRDKANFLGFNVPKNTWMIAMKVNNIDTWERVKSGELRGFSCEAAVSLEDFNKVEENNDIDMNEDMLFSKLTNWFREFFKKDADVDVETSEATKVLPKEDVKLEEEQPTVEKPQEQPKVEEPVTTPPVEEKPLETPTEAENKPNGTPQVEEEKPNDNHIEELIKNLQAEINALKDINKDLTHQVKDLSKVPSTKPVNTNAGNGNKGDSYDNWRQTVRQMFG